MAAAGEAGTRAGIVGLAGKLPAHGDFVRRGGPAAVLVLLDRWLDRELGAAVAGGIALEEAVDALDGWRFAVALDGHDVIGVVIAGEDRVGRRFPLIGALSMEPGLDGVAQSQADAWCAAGALALAAARDAGEGADAALAALAAIAPPESGAEPVRGWWRGDEAAPADGGTDLPTGAAFRALLMRERA